MLIKVSRVDDVLLKRVNESVYLTTVLECTVVHSLGDVENVTNLWLTHNICIFQKYSIKTLSF